MSDFLVTSRSTTDEAGLGAWFLVILNNRKAKLIIV